MSNFLKMKNHHQDRDPRLTLDGLATEMRLLHCGVVALREIVRELEAGLISRAQTSIPLGEIGVIGNSKAVMLQIAKDDQSIECGAARALLEILESSEAFKTAAAIIEPLLKAIEIVEAEEYSKKHDVVRKAAHLRETQAAAEARAIERASNDPEVIAARETLAGAESDLATVKKRWKLF